MSEYEIPARLQCQEMRHIVGHPHVFYFPEYIYLRTADHGIGRETYGDLLRVFHIMAHDYDELAAFGVDPRDEHAESFLTG